MAQDLGNRAPAAVQRLAKTGASGKFPSNVKRDMQKSSESILDAKAEVAKTHGILWSHIVSGLLQCLGPQALLNGLSLENPRNRPLMKVPHLHQLKIDLKNNAGDQYVPTAVPIIAPHELVPWLIRNKLLVLDDNAATKFWEHHSAVASGGVSKCRNFKDGFTVHPMCIYGDEAEYTQTKQKILVIYLSDFPEYFCKHTFWVYNN